MARRIIDVTESFHLSYEYVSNGRMLVISIPEGQRLVGQEVGLYLDGG